MRRSGDQVTRPTPGMARNTRQRAEVLALLGGTDEFRSAQQLHAQLRAAGSGVGLTTVYRTLQILAEVGEVDQMRLPDGEQLYRRCSRSQHHHHLVCRGCGRTVEGEGPPVEKWAEKQAAQHGFPEGGHTLGNFGRGAPRRAPPRATGAPSSTRGPDK